MTPEPPPKTGRTRTRTERTSPPTRGGKTENTPQPTKPDGTPEGIRDVATLDVRFDRVVNAVDDLDVDPTGSEPIDDKMVFEDGTLIEFPPGEYLVTEKHHAYDLERWGIRGLGDHPTDVKLTPPTGETVLFLEHRDCDQLLWQNLAFHAREDWETAIRNIMRVHNNGWILDVHYSGWHGNANTLGGDISRLNVYAMGDTSEIVIDGLVKTGPEKFLDYDESLIFLYSGDATHGTITMRNSRIENCGEHAVYASRLGENGGVHIENCVFADNQNTHVRVSSQNSYVKDSLFLWRENPSNPRLRETNTGLVWESGDHGYTGGLVENCEFVCRNDVPNSGVLKVDGAHGGVRIRDSRFHVDGDGAEPIWADVPGDSHMIHGKPEKPWGLIIENVSITGTGSAQGEHTGAIQINHRDGSVIRDSCIHMTGDRDGIVIADSNWCRIVNTAVDVNGKATLFENSIITPSDITHAELCPDTIGVRSESEPPEIYGDGRHP